jgi:hypothetical protein
MTPGHAAPDRDCHVAPAGRQQRGGQPFHILRGDQPRPVSGRDRRPRRQRPGMRGQEPAKRVIAGSVEPGLAVAGDRDGQGLPGVPGGQPGQQAGEGLRGRVQFLPGGHDARAAHHGQPVTGRARHGG